MGGLQGRSARVRLVRSRADAAFDALGTRVRIAVEGVGADAQVARARRLVLDYHRRLSRFRPSSELCALNADPRERVPASPMLCDAVRAGLWAARASGGLVDPCLLDALEAAGYRESLAGREADRATAAPPPDLAPRRAAPDPRARWREIAVGDSCIVRPPGLRLDLGGSGKGHVADLVAAGLHGRWLVDCGGDLRVGGEWDVEVEHAPGVRLRVRDGAVATSSVLRRAWAGGHHLLDPASGLPVRTGVVAATALAATTLEAETHAKVAVLAGREAARRVRLWVDESGAVHA